MGVWIDLGEIRMGRRGQEKKMVPWLGSDEGERLVER
jgi:hypothetical protein